MSRSYSTALAGSTPSGLSASSTVSQKFGQSPSMDAYCISWGYCFAITSSEPMVSEIVADSITSTMADSMQMLASPAAFCFIR